MRRTAQNRLLCACVAAAAVVCAPGRGALAQDPSELPDSQLGGVTAGGGLDLAQKAPYWSSGRNRAFISSTMELGIFYLRPQIAVGYGRPHWRWIGLEEQSRVSASGGSEYVGVHGALPRGDLRVGGRYVFTLGQTYLPPAEAYVEDDLEYDEEPRSRYVALEAELSGSLPLFGGALFATVTGFHMLGVPDDLYVYEDQLHVVMKPPWLWRARGGYLFTFGEDDGLHVGVAAEVIGNPARDSLVVRAGPQIAVALTHHLETALSLMIVAASPDKLRLHGNEIGQFGFRYKWASGDVFPEFP